MADRFAGMLPHELAERVGLGAPGSLERAVHELLDERQELISWLRSSAPHRVGDQPCWCRVAPWKDRWQHDPTCREIYAIVDA
jgi:hypothetical protein